MSVIKFISGKNRELSQLKTAVDYVLNKEKTGGKYIACNGVSAEEAYEDMRTVKMLHGKERGRQYIHFVISFNKGVSSELAFRVSRLCAKYYENEYQFVLAIHTNTSNVHAHVILNTVNAKTGKKFGQSRGGMLKFRDYANDILRKNGLNTVGKIRRMSIGTRWEDNMDPGINQILIYTDEDDGTSMDFLGIIQDAGDDIDINVRDGFFGPVDEAEVLTEILGDQQEKNLRQIERFFEGEDDYLPDNYDFEEAEIEYEKMKAAEETWRCQEWDDQSWFDKD